MDKRNFFTLQNVQPSELNDLVAAIDQAIGQAGLESNIRGVVYGLTVGPTDPTTLAVQVLPGVALYDDLAPSGSNERTTACRLSTTSSLSLALDYLGASTAVTVGNERWVSIVIRPATVDSDPRTDGLGNVVNFVTTESAELIVVSGAEAAVGSAIRPSVTSIGIRLADFLMTYGATEVAAVDTGAREACVTRIRGGAGTNAKGYSLFWQSERDTSAVGVLRAYLSIGDVAPAGVVVTLNALWSVNSQKWIGTNGTPCMALKFCANGILFTVRTEALSTGWIDAADGSWNDTTTPSATDSILLSKDGLKVFSKARSALLESNGVVTASGGTTQDLNSVTVVVSVMTTSGASEGGGGVPTLGSAVTFPRPFSATPVIVEVSSTDYGPGGGVPGTGSSYDNNVSSVEWMLTKWGLICLVHPTAASTRTWYNRVVTISAPVA
jgi:hypothetical protein